MFLNSFKVTGASLLQNKTASEVYSFIILEWHNFFKILNGANYEYKNISNKNNMCDFVFNTKRMVMLRL